MGQYVICFGVGVDGHRSYLTDWSGERGSSSSVRKAQEFSDRKSAAEVQDQLLAMSQRDINRVLRKPADYTEHLSISVLSFKNQDAKGLNVRHKLYIYPNQEQNNVA